MAMRAMTATRATAARGPWPVFGQQRPLPRQSLVFARDFGITLTVVGVYFLLRGLAPTRIDFSMTVTDRLLEIERATHTFWEPWIQEHSIRWHPVQEVANFTYAYLHFPVLIVVGVWLWWSKGRERFVFMRDVMFISMVIGVVFYYLLPAAPPRLLAAHGVDLGFTDTVFGGDTEVKYAQPSMILNEYAAIPSFHFGWIAMAAAAVWMNSRSVVLRGLLVGLVVLMTWAIVASANHLWIDMALGGAVVAASWWIAAKVHARRPMRELREPVVLVPGRRAAA